jgi:hypothetical protein
MEGVFMGLLLLWVTRIWSGLGVLIWGSFLVAHLQEWLLFPTSSEPLPVFVIWALILHGGMVLGLLGSIFQIRIMAALAVICAAGFFLGVVGMAGLGYFLATIPSPLFILANWGQTPTKNRES